MSRPSPPPAHGLRRVLYVAAGLFFVGMAYLGVILPGLPATPWVLLAGWCFARSSPRLEGWLKRTPYFGTLLTDWQTHRGMRRRVKWTATCILVPVVAASVLSGRLPEWALWTIGGLAACGLGVIWLLVPTVPADGRGV